MYKIINIYNVQGGTRRAKSVSLVTSSKWGKFMWGRENQVCGGIFLPSLEYKQLNPIIFSYKLNPIVLKVTN